MSQEGTFNWRGLSGKTYTFEVWKDTWFYEVECVYIYTKLVNGSWQCIYIGQTEHLATRLQEHKNGDSGSDKCIQRSGATHIHVLELKPQAIRLDVETDLRNKYRWSCNMQ
jgi:predicted GIY-YIG superfamily endonuclease